MTPRFLFLPVLVLGWAVPATAGPWPFRSTQRVVDLGDSVVAVQRVWKALVRQPIPTSECRSPRDSGKKQWKWKLTGTLFYFYDRVGQRLTPHGYDLVGRTEQGLIYGIILATGKYDPATYEAVSPTGNVTPIRAVTTGYPPSGRLYYRYRKKRD